MEFKPGFRMSTLDACILVIGAVAAYMSFKYQLKLSFAIIFVVCHFFLFCNIVRAGRILELIWASVFLSLESMRIVSGLVSLQIVLLASLALTFIVVFLECKRPSYHGAFWRLVNPNLEAWFEENMKKESANIQSSRPLKSAADFRR
jgi:hypothetical protein